MGAVPYPGGFLPFGKPKCFGTKYRVRFEHFIAYDPILWMHHCNADCLTALWQVMNYDISATTGMNRSAGMGFIVGQALTKETRMSDGA